MPRIKSSVEFIGGNIIITEHSSPAGTLTKQYEELMGMRINRWEVLEFSHYNYRIQKAYVVCKCMCGTIKTVLIPNILNNTSKSCGCLKKEKNSNYNKGKLRKCRTLPGIGGLNSVYGSYKHKAKSEEREFNLSKEEVKSITSSNCFYCRIEPRQVATYGTSCSMKSREHSKYLYNGIDRVDNTRGYTLDNVVPCCIICNKAKRDMLYSDFISWIERLTGNIGAVKSSKQWH